MEMTFSQMQSITPAELDNWSRLIHRISGIVIDTSKGYLLESRLAHLCQETGSKSFGDLYFKVRADSDGPLILKVIDAITTRETFFFRDTAPFIILKEKIIPKLIRRQKADFPTGSPIPIRIWSAGCSTGQEAYSIMMVFHEVLGGISPGRLRLLGTDISEEAVNRAEKGIFTPHEISRGLTPTQTKRFFHAGKNQFQIREEIRSQAEFQRLDVLKSLPSGGRFDIIFFRNVGIYFSERDREILLPKLVNRLEPGGVLFLGGSESLNSPIAGLAEKKYQKGTYYQKA